MDRSVRPRLSIPAFRSDSGYLLDLPVLLGLAWGFTLPECFALPECFTVPERFALPVCTTVVEPPPVAFAAAPNAAPAAAPLATGWLLCCSSAGGGGGGGGGCSAVGGCSAGGDVCDVACGIITVMTASAVTSRMRVFKAFIWPPNPGSSVPATYASGEVIAYVLVMLPAALRSILGIFPVQVSDKLPASER